MAGVRQTNFGGGELAPMSWGRNDRPAFGRALRTMRNFFPTKQHGSAVSRPGSLYIGTTKDNGPTVRLLPFVYSDSLSYCVEMGIYGAARNLYFRFYSNGAQLTGRYVEVTMIGGAFAVGDLLIGGTTGSRGTVVSIKTDDGALKLQVGMDPMYGTGSFQAGEMVDCTPEFTSTGSATVVAETYEVLELQSGTVSSNFDILKVKFAQLGAVLVLTHPEWAPLQLALGAEVFGQKNFTLESVSFAPPVPYFSPTSAAGSYPVLRTVGSPTATTPDREWVYLVTLTVQEWKTGRIIETLPWRVTEQWDGNIANAPTTFYPDVLSVYLENPVTLRRGPHIDGPQGPLNVFNGDYRVIQANYYRGRGAIPGGVYGYVGSTEGDEFKDLGREPDYFTPPPFGTQPFKVVDRLGTIEYERPYSVAWFQNRLCFGGTNRRPGTILTSETGAFDRWDLPTIVHWAGEALEFELASRKFEQIVHLVPHQKLVIGTTSSVWSMSGTQGPLDFDNVDARVIDEVGMTELQPLIVDGRIIYARAKGTGVRGLHFDGNFGTYDGVDLSGLSDHLFVGDSIGAAGARTNKELVDWCYAEDPWGLVWAVRADGTLLSLTLGQEGAYGWARHDGLPTSTSAYYGYGTPAAYKRVCSVPEGDEDAVYVIVQRPLGGIPAGNLPVPPTSSYYCVERMTSRVRRGNSLDDCCLDCAVQKNVYLAGLNASLTITGLDHLEGENVYFCATGNAPQGPFLVTGGAITLGNWPVANNGAGGVAGYVGLLYHCDLETLDVVSAESKLKKKTVTRVGFEVDQASGLLGGVNFTDLREVQLSTVEDGYAAPVPHTALATVVPSRRWDEGGRATLRQSLPLPVTVVGVVRDVEIGG